MTAPDTGESSASINRRSDDEAWPHVRAELETGATLLRIPKLRRAYPDRGDGPYGRGLNDARVRKLEREGIIQFVGVDRYSLAARAKGGVA